MPEPKLLLHRKLAEVMAEAERIPKKGSYKKPGEYGHFMFVQVGDAADAIRKALADRKVSMLPSGIEVMDQSEHETKSGGTMTTITVRTTWTLVDGETGESATIQSIGTGADAGDKYSPKAQTNAMKYALLMGFLLSTGDDPELSDSSDRRARQSDGPYQEPEEVLLGDETRSGKMVAGTAPCDLAWREGPDGHAIGFTLRIADDKNIPQVILKGEMGEAVYIATAGDPAALKGKAARVAGRVFELRKAGARTSYRMYVSHIKTDDFEYPAQEAETLALPLVIPPDEAEAIKAAEMAEAASA